MSRPIDIYNLDRLLSEIKQSDTSVDFKAFCRQHLGIKNLTDCLKLSEKLISDGYAMYLQTDKSFLTITESGKDFIGYVQTIKNLDEIDKLRTENLILSNEKMEYEKTIRRLEEELKISSLIKNWWWLIGAAISLGVAIGAYLLSLF